MLKNQKISENLKQRYANGRETRQKIDETKRITGGVLFKANHILLDEEVLRIRKGKEKEKADEREKVILNAINAYNKNREAYHEVINSNVEEMNYKGAHYKAIINYLKVKKDEKMPTRVADLKVRYDEIKTRTPLTVQQFLTDKGYMEEDIRITDHLLGPPPLVPPAAATDQDESVDDLLDGIEAEMI